jgi:DNA-binding CsgD family transcriptional regulator
MPSRFDIFSAARQPFADAAECGAFLSAARDRLGVLNLSYWHLGAPGQGPGEMSWFTTYDEGYQSLYRREYSPLRDGAFRACFRSLLPLDWEELRQVDETVRPIHAVAERFGIGRHGISIPIREPGAGDAMFSVNFDCEDRHWPELRKELANSVHLFAHYFHLRMKTVIASAAAQCRAGLSPREREVLRWAAEGKTAWETAQLLGVSESAVSLYMGNAMTKLGAATKTQAVAIAIRNLLLQ